MTLAIGRVAAVAAVVGLALVASGCSAGTGVAGAGGWGAAAGVPGLAALNTGTGGGGGAQIAAVSCASPGSCAAGGYYSVAGYARRAFVVSEVHGIWGRAMQVPGLAELGKGSAEVKSVSCASPGSCAAGGYYQKKAADSGDYAFVVSQVHGTWGRAVPVTGTAGGGGPAVISSVSCAAAGSCAAVGGSGTVFVVSQVNGTWGQARQVPGMAALDKGGSAVISTVSCGSAGNCAAGGSYTGRSGSAGAFVVSQVHGIWGQARQVPGMAALTDGAGAQVSSMSCASAGNCAAGGGYSARRGGAFVVSQVHGIWGQARQVPGMAALADGAGAAVSSVSCASAGNCAAGGYYGDGPDGSEAFIVSQVHGIWGKARQVPGMAALNKRGDAGVVSVSCASPGNCAAGGHYSDGPGRSGHPDSQAFVVTAANGIWGQALEVPGTAALDTGQDAATASVSCPAASRCSAAGSYYDGSALFQAFVTSQP